ncbi:MAG: histidine phosphatase family protein [Acidimicrobiales bacterium]
MIWSVDRPRLFLVRHGQTEWSSSGRHTGRTDIPLDGVGRVQAEAVGRVLGAEEFSLVLTSPLSRAKATCELAGFADRAIVTDDLSEWDYGQCEGRTTEEIRQDDPGWTVWTHGVAGGETAADVGRRADRIVERARSATGDVLCFAHGHLLRVLASRWVGLPPVGGRVLALSAGSLGVLGWEREVPVIDRWNQLPTPAR